MNVSEGVVVGVFQDMSLKMYILPTWLSPRDVWSRSNTSQLHRSIQVCTRVRIAFREDWNETHYLPRLVCESLFTIIGGTCNACVHAFITGVPIDNRLLVTLYIDIGLQRHGQTLYPTTWFNWN